MRSTLVRTSVLIMTLICAGLKCNESTAQDFEIKPLKTSDHLHNVWQLSPRILSGSEPMGDEAFRELAQLGVQTILSVDGLAPDVKGAAKYGLRYVHIPFGYDGIPEESRLALTRAARDIKGKIYVHCHHGKHRGPAGAAVLCRADDGRSREAAAKILKAAGTSSDYAGLYRDVAGYTVPPADAKLPPLQAVQSTKTAAQEMAELDRDFDATKPLMTSLLKSPTEDVAAARAATEKMTLIHEHFLEFERRLPAGADADLKSQVGEAKKTTESMIEELKRTMINREVADGLWKKVESSCARCHAAHRNS
ncbi:MAG: hypothetical protein U0892_12390 [Pirellulales bacterium]